jgi:hypothetical protein
MPRPYTDIIAIDSSKPINNKTATCSTTVTGYSSRRIIRTNLPVNLTIANVQQKFGNRFYNGLFVNVLSGEIDGGLS